MTYREDLIRAYENGWLRKKTFARGFKHGRVHGEGANVMSYVAKSREVAQWLVAKADDTITIKGVEYKILFKAWMTRAELEEQRRREDETKLWVVALQVLIVRAMFHVGDLVPQSMGPIIHRHPPEPDATRPKLMNLKFDLAREAEEKFEALLPMKLNDGDLYNVQFVNKNTAWCTGCRWWFHTETDGCPRATEDETTTQGVAGGGSRRIQQGEVVFERAFRSTVGDPHNPSATRGESSAAAEARRSGSFQMTTHANDRNFVPTGGRALPPAHEQNDLREVYPVGALTQSALADIRTGSWASIPGAPDPCDGDDDDDGEDDGDDDDDDDDDGDDDDDDDDGHDDDDDDESQYLRVVIKKSEPRKDDGGYAEEDNRENDDDGVGSLGIRSVGEGKSKKQKKTKEWSTVRSLLMNRSIS
ncbi:hypothetical protein CBR_g31347 [Chara braunii]|uniref:Uncharacterized protein n=1 Tax=Chara braunii TaxID=69332 RepID=A0A388LES5_CHABU|nr:hypothetical protein CBR_g31347 [Chara braunii]|eukprot:GBG80791.1 hypothetical protein CBR_g31347 [Chara braunii]